MCKEPFVDYYELLQVSPRADTETISRVFRHLAKKAHPDSQDEGDTELFEQLVEAHKVLTNPEQRAAFDARYHDQISQQWRLLEEATGGKGTSESDRTVRDRVLTLMYLQRRRDLYKPGLGELELERMVDCPRNHLEFHLWYLRQKAWIERTESGTLAITAEGVDRVEETRLMLRPDRLLAESGAPTEPEAPAPRRIRGLDDKSK
jgi:curved DNA-binding protein CbpA